MTIMKNRVKCPNCNAVIETTFNLQVECSVCGYMVDIETSTVDEKEIKENSRVQLNESRVS